MAITETMHLHSAGEEPKPRFDYRGRHRYLITLETVDGRPLFTSQEPVRAVLGALRDQSLAHHFEVLVYSFLPSSLTLLVRGKEEGAHMKTFLAAFRAAATEATAATAGPRLWKRTYRERVLRKTEELRSVIRDVAMIPVRAGLASTPLAYEFQGSFVDELRSLLPWTPRPQRPPGTSAPTRFRGGKRPGGPPFKPGNARRTGGPKKF
jgi:putative transposase